MKLGNITMETDNEFDSDESNLEPKNVIPRSKSFATVSG